MRFFFQNSAWIESISYTEILSLGELHSAGISSAATGSVLYYCHRTRDIPVHWWEGDWFQTRITHCINGQFCVSFHGKIPFMLKGTLSEIENITKQLFSVTFAGGAWWTSSCLSQVWLHYTAWLCWVVINHF